MSDVDESENWTQCALCPAVDSFKDSSGFLEHLTSQHCKIEDDLYICNYGANDICLVDSGPFNLEEFQSHVQSAHLVNDGEVSQQSRKPPGPSAFQQLLQKHARFEHSGSGDRSDSSGTNSYANQSNSWSVYQCTANLPAVLNDPRRAKRETDFFTKTWGENFTETQPIPQCVYLRNVTRARFEKYLSRTTKRFKRHVRQNAPDSINEKKRLLLRGLEALSDSIADDISSVPSIFLRPDFDLSNPEVFHAVLPWSNISPSGAYGSSSEPSTPVSPAPSTSNGRLSPAMVSPSNGRVTSQPTSATDKNAKPPKRVKSTSILLQEKLAHYLDIVEVQLARQVSQHSEAFFQAMTSHDTLTDKLAETLDSVLCLRSRLKGLDNNMVRESLRVIHLARLREHYKMVYQKLHSISNVQQAQPTIQSMLASSDFVGALDLIEATQDVLAVELAGIQSFRHLGSQLEEIKSAIEKMMLNDFVKYTAADLNRPLSAGIAITDEANLRSVVCGLLRMRKTSFVYSYQEEACTAVEAMVKQTVIEHITKVDDLDSLDECDIQPRPSPFDRTRSLDITAWLSLFEAIFANLDILLQRIKVVHHLMEDAVHQACVAAETGTTGRGIVASPATTTTNSALVNGHLDATNTTASKNLPSLQSVALDGAAIRAQLNDMLVQVCNKAHDACALLFTAQGSVNSAQHQQQQQQTAKISQNHNNNSVKLASSVDVVNNGGSNMAASPMDRLNANDFEKLYKTIEHFGAKCESICGKRSTGLWLALQGRANRFIMKYHTDNKHQLSLVLDNEQWVRIQIPSYIQAIVDHISEGGAVGKNRQLLAQSFDDSITPQNWLFFEGENFALSGSALHLLKLVLDYCQCATDLPLVAADLLTRLVELLDEYNTRTFELVLRSPAFKLHGLTPQTVNNMVMASQSLHMLLALQSRVKTHFEKYLQSRQLCMLRYFDEVKKRYADHVVSIRERLVALVCEQFDAQLAEYVVRAPVPSPIFRTLTRLLVMVHSSAAKVLTKERAISLLAECHEAFVLRLRHHIVVRLKVNNDGGPQHGMITQELTFYAENLKRLDFEPVFDDLWSGR